MTAHRALQDNLIADYVIPGDAAGVAIVPDRSPAQAQIVTLAAETRTLPAPLREGLSLSISLRTDGGDCVITASAGVNQAGNTIMTLADAGDIIELKSIRLGDAYVWRVIANDGVALS